MRLIDRELSPAAIREIIDEGQKSAKIRLHARGIITTEGKVSDPITLGKAYVDFRRCFEDATRHDFDDPHGPTKDSEIFSLDPRQKLALSIKAAAIVCTVRQKIQNLQPMEKLQAEAAIETQAGMGSVNKDENFHKLYLKDRDHPEKNTVLPKVIEWLEIVMGNTLMATQIEEQKPKLIDALNAMFDVDLQPTKLGAKTAPEFMRIISKFYSAIPK